eukprot:UN05289
MRALFGIPDRLRDRITPRESIDLGYVKRRMINLQRDSNTITWEINPSTSCKYGICCNSKCVIKLSHFPNTNNTTM